MSRSYCIVLTTFSKERTGSKIIDALLAAKLAACIQVLPIRSFYAWKGKISRDKESLMLIKARSKDFRDIKETIVANHDYLVPEIVSVRIERGLAGYLKWMNEVTR